MIKSHFKIKDAAANYFFAEASKKWHTDNTPAAIKEEQASLIVDTILRDITKLNGKLGLFGGEERRIEGKRIKIAKGVASIFDDCMKYKRKECSAAQALTAIINTAGFSQKYQGHTIFNRRQKEVSSFYKEVATMIEPKAFISSEAPNAPYEKLPLPDGRM